MTLNILFSALSRFILKSDTDLENSPTGRSRGRVKADDAFFRYCHDVADVTTSQNDFFVRTMNTSWNRSNGWYPIAGALVTEVLREQSGGGRRRRRSRGRERAERFRETRRGGSVLFDLYRPSRSTNDWGARSDVGPAIASPSYFHVACSRFQWRRGIESLSMGHLPLPSSSTAAVKRRGGLSPDCPPLRVMKWGRNIPHRPLSSLAPLFLLPRHFWTYGKHCRNIDSTFLGQLFLLHRETSFVCCSCHSSSVTSSSFLINFVTHARGSRPTRRQWIRGQAYFTHVPDTDRRWSVMNEDSDMEKQIWERKLWNKNFLAGEIPVPMSSFVIKKTNEKIRDLYLLIAHSVRNTNARYSVSFCHDFQDW